MNLLLLSPELPLRIIHLSLIEDEGASQADVNASVSAAGQLWVGDGSWQVQGGVLAMACAFCLS